MKLIVIPTLEEAQQLIKKTQTLSVKKNFLTLYKLSSDYLLAITRIGLVNSAMNLTWIINNYDIELIINLGTTAAVNNNLKILNTVLITKATYLDANNTCFGYEFGQIPQEKPYYSLTKTQVNYIENKLSTKLDFKLATVASSNSFINKEKLSFIHDSFPYIIDVVDMETTSLWNVANNFGINFYCIRVISDVISDFDNHLKFSETMTEASKKIFDIFIIIQNSLD
ncbi:5'-methylthioadenosine/S-adenosylhomocysteine nucleosidase [Spiroplasma endosymbiont of Amphibalanus improvisus]|uniref:5'-methylthioadenosine/S-adenosylhomocysteine nucleosidase n=1 Tax=Spiroplasma endosymbiont of Amphibalanus improvisus TaxID=3066327 RepID=UPI00313AFDC4